MGDRLGGTAAGRGPSASRLRRSVWAGAAATSLVCALVAGGLLASTGNGALPHSVDPGTLELSPGATRLIGLSVTPSPSPAAAATATGPQPAPNPPGANANGVLLYVIGNLHAVVTADKPTAGHISNAIALLNRALASNLWSGTDGNHVDPKNGNQVFDRVHDAVGELQAIKKPPPAWVGANIGYLEYAVRLIASTLKADNSCSPKKQNELNAASNELSNGDSEFDKSHFPEAVDHYKSAWNHAGNAQGVSCAVPGLSVQPLDKLFDVTNLVPGDQVPKSATVQVTGTSGSVTLSGTTPHESKPGFASHLQLTVVDPLAPPSSPPIYHGSLSDLPARGQITVDGSGPGGTWLVNEQRTFSFTIAFDATSDNSLQGATASSTLVWSRT